jgi:hypothetical protein
MAASIKKILTPAVMLCAIFFATGVLAVEQLDDPTRPAIDLMPALSGVVADDGAAHLALALGLQSVIISHNRVAAIINGVEVQLGQKYGDATLTTVNETCVVLTGPQGTQVMHMFPDVSMTKGETACVKKTDMLPIEKTADINSATENVKTKIVATKKPKAKLKKRKVICVPVEDKKSGENK